MDINKLNIMKNKIKEIQDYFINKIVAGYYEVQEKNENYITIIVDNEYFFNLWIAGGLKFFELWAFGSNFMTFEFSQEQKETIYNRVKISEDELKHLKIKELEQQLKKLKNE